MNASSMPRGFSYINSDGFQMAVAIPVPIAIHTWCPRQRSQSVRSRLR